MAQSEKDLYTQAIETINSLTPDEVKSVLSYVSNLLKPKVDTDAEVEIDESLILSDEEVQRMIDPSASTLKGEALIKYRENSGAIGMLDIDPKMDSVTWLKEQREKRARKNRW